jgi:hypothetical protein
VYETELATNDEVELVTAVASVDDFTVTERVLAATANLGLVIPAAWVNVIVIKESAAIPLSPRDAVAVCGSISGTVIVTARPEIVTAPAETNWSAVPAPLPAEILEDFTLIAEAAIELGTVNLLSNVTVMVPPTAIAPCEPLPDTVTVCCAVAPAVVGVEVTATVPTPALAGLTVKAPKANIVAIAAMAKSAASPKDVPILVFIYSYLLSSCCLKRRMTS